MLPENAYHVFQYATRSDHAVFLSFRLQITFVLIRHIRLAKFVHRHLNKKQDYWFGFHSIPINIDCVNLEPPFTYDLET